MWALKTSQSIRCHSDAGFFKNTLIRALFYLFLFYVFLVASINKLKLEKTWLYYSIFNRKQYRCFPSKSL